jgi:shikimate kinase
MRTPHVVLVGYRGSGKTTCGQSLARRLAWGYADSDQEVERRLGRSIAAAVAAAGMDAFRACEAAVVADLLARPGSLVIATGGGCVIDPATRQRLRASGALVAYLAVPAAVLQERLAQRPGARMSLTGAGVAEEVPVLLAQRDPWYREVAGCIIAADCPEAEVVEKLRAAVESWTGPVQNPAYAPG